MDKIDELLSRGVANVIPSQESLKKLLLGNKKLNVYLGIDPTSVHIHLGHATHLRRLQALADLGHHVTFIIGDFTALVGDTSDKDSERPILTPEEIETNWQTYKAQAEKVINFENIKIKRNSEWLNTLSAQEFLKLLFEFSLNDFTSRELIRKRLDSGNSVRLPEAIYPALQGYDSWHLDTDIQLGGADQTFNMQAGRILQKNWRNKESFVLVGQYLTGTDGRKMSKSWGNAIWLDDTPADVYGKVMSIKDDLLEEYFTLATNIDTPDLSNPLEAKKKLAHQIVLELHGQTTADQAQAHFESIIQQGRTPQDIPQIRVTSSNIVEVLVETKLAASKSEAKRLIEQSGVYANDHKIQAIDQSVDNGAIIQVGPRKFIRVSLKP